MEKRKGQREEIREKISEQQRGEREGRRGEKQTERESHKETIPVSTSESLDVKPWLRMRIYYKPFKQKLPRLKYFLPS